MAHFLDQALGRVEHFTAGSAAFTSTATQNGGQETTLF
jgi:hypothetical protein